MIWITGASGMLGAELTAVLAERGLAFTGTDREVDILDRDALLRHAEGRGIRAIINCAAYTAVDRAEQEPGAANALNGRAPGILAGVAEEIGAGFIHLSTDYVFDGEATSPYYESHPLSPLGVYGQSKARGELAALQAMPDALILRTAWLYGLHGPNFPFTMLRLFASRPEVRVVDDQRGSPTWAGDLAGGILELLGNKAAGGGIYHFAGGGETTWFGFATAILEEAKTRGMITDAARLLPITSAEYPSAAKRPAYSVLSTQRFHAAVGRPPRPWTDSLHEFMERLDRDPAILKQRTGISRGAKE